MKNSHRVLRCLIFASVACLVLLLIIPNYSGVKKKMIERRLETFYRALYIDSDLTQASRGLAKEQREMFLIAMTLAGTDEDFFEHYHSSARKILGDSFDLTIQIKNITPINDGELSENIEEKDRIYKVEFSLVFSDYQGKTMENEMSFVMQKTLLNWEMLSYLPFPIGKDVLAY